MGKKYVGDQIGHQIMKNSAEMSSKLVIQIKSNGIKNKVEDSIQIVHGKFCRPFDVIVNIFVSYFRILNFIVIRIITSNSYYTVLSSVEN